MFNSHTVEIGNGLLRLIDLAVAVVESRSFGEEEDSYTENNTPQETNPKRNSPRSSVFNRLSTEVDEIG